MYFLKCVMNKLQKKKSMVLYIFEQNLTIIVFMAGYNIYCCCLEADIYLVITGSKAQSCFVPCCCLAIAMTLCGCSLSTSSLQSLIRSNAIRVEKSHWANSIPAFQTGLSNLVDRDELDFEFSERRSGQIMFGRGINRHSSSGQSSLVECHNVILWGLSFTSRD